jgi:hypothetical protein
MAKIKAQKQDDKKLLANVPEEYVFWCTDGRILRNMIELQEALDTMVEEVFVFHVNTTKNDFANWVRDIIKDEKLASDLQKAQGRIQAKKHVASRINTLSRKAK